jgi:hypothetical protein
MNHLRLRKEDRIEVVAAFGAPPATLVVDEVPLGKAGVSVLR